MTAAATSSPRFAGRQWRKIASGLASAISFSVTWKGAESARALLALALLAHRSPDVGVDGVGARHRGGGIVNDRERGARRSGEPSRIGQDAACPVRSRVGSRSSCRARRGLRSRAASGRRCRRRRRRTRADGRDVLPNRSSIVSRSASAWHGWCLSESALTTGTVAQRASSSTVSCANVRITIAET